MRFFGNIEAKADSKGRVFLPATFRKVLQAAGEETLLLRKNIFHPSLVLYPMSAWNRRVDKIRERVNEYDAESMMIFRQFISEAEEVTLDGNGRFLIPRRLLNDADIIQSVRLMGVDDTIEIWAAEKLKDHFLPDKDFSSKLSIMMS
jgi:MraZ protein